MSDLFRLDWPLEPSDACILPLTSSVRPMYLTKTHAHTEEIPVQLQSRVVD